MATVLKWLALIVKALSAVTAFAAVTDNLPPKWAAWATLGFMAASSLKDGVNRIGDMLDDGVANNSWKP